MNQVDTSPETIESEFDAAAEAIGIEPEQPAQTPEAINAIEEAEREAQIAIAEQMMMPA